MISDKNIMIIGALTGAIGSAVYHGVVRYKTDREFKQWVDQKLVPVTVEVANKYTPKVIEEVKKLISVKFNDQPVKKEIILELLSYSQKTVDKFSKDFLNRLYENKDQLPGIVKELELIGE